MENMEELLPTYTLSEIMEKEHKDSRTIKKSKRYFAVKIENYQSKYHFEHGTNKKPYSIKYIKLEDIKNLYKIKSGGERLTTL